MTDEKKIGFLTSTSLVIASMVGTGIFTSLGFQVINIQTGFALLMLWIIGGIDAFCGATVYAELGSAFPRSGGEYSLLSRLFHPSLGFVAGWVSATVGFAAPASIAAIALGSYLKTIFPTLPENHTAAIIVILFSIVHGSSMYYGTLLQNISTVLKILLMVCFIGLGFMISASTTIQFYPDAQSWPELISGPFAVALVFVSYSYTGWNSSIYVVGQIDKPSNLRRSLFIGTGIVMAIYLLITMVFLLTVPIDKLAGQIEVGYLSANAIFGSVGGKIMAGLISFLLLSTVSAYIFLGPRIMQVIGEDFQALKWFSRTSKQGIPVNAFIFSCLISLTFIYTSTFDEVVVYTSFLLILMTTLTVAGIFILRIKFKHIQTPYRTWGYPITPIIFLAINSWILVYLVMEKRYESFVAVLVMIIGLLIYLITKRLNR